MIVLLCASFLGILIISGAAWLEGYIKNLFVFCGVKTLLFLDLSLRCHERGLL